MANKTTHIIAGSIAGAASYLVFKNSEGVSPKELLSCIVTGAFCGILPDILEPPTSPFHRQSFHSLMAGAVITGSTIFISKESVIGRILISGSIGYLSHLTLDARTPMRLPLI